jgi:hypothetical protein
MSHTFLSLGMNLIPQATKDNVPTFYSALFSNDNSRMLIDGRNDKGELVHSWEVLLAWLQWESDPLATLDLIIDGSIEYTAQEFNVIKNDVDSIWYVEQEVIL